MNNDLQASDKPVQTEESPQATTVFVLGIIGVVLCQILGIIALVMGNSEFKKGYPKTGLLYAGWILGIIGTVLLGLLIVFSIIYVVVIFLFLGAAGASGAFN